jgi:hypothetical protein
MRQTVPNLGFGGVRYPSIVAANFGGITNRLRCLMTCNAFSRGKPTLGWGENWSDAKLHDYSTEQAATVFDVPLLPATDLWSGNLPWYDNWFILTPEIMCTNKATIALCLSALNGDGLKAGAALYQLPDRIFFSLQNNLTSLFQQNFLDKLQRLANMCRTINYAAISLRFWVECPSSLSLDVPDVRLSTNWKGQQEFAQAIKSIEHTKWPRLRPAAQALKNARQYIGHARIGNVILMTDRWDGTNYYSGATGKIRECLETEFPAGLPRLIANMFVIANSKILVRSKDSSYTHLPLLLSDKWSISIIDI